MLSVDAELLVVPCVKPCVVLAVPLSCLTKAAGNY